MGGLYIGSGRLWGILVSDIEKTIADVPLPEDLAVLHETVSGPLQQTLLWLVDFVHTLGYPGIFIMTFLESTFMPIPSEVTMIPVGYLVQQGHMNLYLALFFSITGTVGGALFNYWLAVRYGRSLVMCYGKYFLFGTDKMEKLDRFFANHGEISTFTGRLIPGLRHFISFPAGLAKMDLKKFTIYTTAGGALWMSTLIAVGYIIGGSKEQIRAYMPYVTGGCIAAVILMVSFYVWRHRKLAINSKEPNA